MILQSHRIFDKLTIDENLRLAGGKIQGKKERQLAIDRGCRYFPSLAAVPRKKPAAQLSGGQQQMLVLAQGLVTSPRILLLDEPTAGLSPTVVRDVEFILRDLKDSGVALLMAEHNLNFVRSLSDKIFEFEVGEAPREISI
jgi:branched-chain amino acid transport system ATP-binding protein